MTKPLDPDAPFQNEGAHLEFRVADFWQWGFSDLKQNSLRGTLAEFLVARATGASPPDAGTGWDDYDLITPGGIKIEVKSSAYVQSWRQSKPSRICFSRLSGRVWDREKGYAAEPTYRANVFVFCVQTAKTDEEYDPLNIDQWRFYPVHGDAIQRLSQKSLGLSTLETLCPTPVPYEKLNSAIQKAAATPPDTEAADDANDRDGPQTWVTDITHFLDNGKLPATLPGPARTLAEFLGSIVREVTRSVDGEPDDVLCRRREGLRPCNGAVVAWVDDSSGQIVWRCDSCGDNGYISKWRGSPWDSGS